MFNRITARTRNTGNDTLNKEVVLDLSSQYRFTKVDGLGPVKASISTVEMASESGSTFLSSKDSVRNIVLYVELKPDYSSGQTYTALRRYLYEVFTPRSEVQLTFNDAVLDAMSIMGYVESHEPDIFSDNPAVQISVLCPDPYFRNPSSPSTVVNVASSSAASFNVPYSGHVPVGFLIEYDVNETLSEAKLTLLKTGTKGELTVHTAFQAGDRIRINTVPGQKYVQRVRGGEVTSILGAFSGAMSPMKLENGQNYFTFNRRWSIDGFKITYRTLYGGL